MTQATLTQNAVSTHADDLEKLFSHEGPFQQSTHNFKPRKSQLDMACAIAHAISEQTTLVAEAGTGTGKTFAYLVPTLLWGGKVIVSTGTKNLQDQLFLRDIPTVRKVLNIPVSISLLKGRANYVCHYHLERTLENGRLTSRDDVSYLHTIKRFIKTTSSGDKSELPNVPENALIWNLVTSTRENCLGADCPHYQDCFVVKARKEAQQADVVVVNHHLFFADIALKDSGVAELLPTANTIIFDEAHQLPDTATLFFGDVISTAQVLELCRDVLAEGLTHARDVIKWGDVVIPVERAARDLRLVFTDDTMRLSVNQIAGDSTFFAQLDALVAQLNTLTSILESQAERAETIEQCRVRSIELQEKFKQWYTDGNAADKDGLSVKQGDASILWVEAFSSSLQLHRTPLSIATIFAKQREGTPRTWIFTSATLAVKNDFSHYTSQMGLSDTHAQSWPSPFDYENQGLLYVPNNMPLPHSPDYIKAVVDAAIPLIKASNGRAFLLCTTLRAVNLAAQYLRDAFNEQTFNFPLFIQGEVGKTELLDRFRAAGNGILIGSQSFWEGIDVRGEALSLVIIDKLPFSPPDDPILSARIKMMEQQGLNGFMHHQLPEAIIALKQGAGRLIRDETDRGVLMICDPRLISKPYGKKIWQSLPPFKRTREQSVACAFFQTNKDDSC